MANDLSNRLKNPSRSPKRGCVIQHNPEDILGRAYRDDAETNNGYMFGTKSVSFFTQGGKYPERWFVIGKTEDGVGHQLLRTTENPHSDDVVWDYYPSNAFDPASPYDKATFVPRRRVERSESEAWIKSVVNQQRRMRRKPQKKGVQA
jgi:hypothetical protein